MAFYFLSLFVNTLFGLPQTIPCKGRYAVVHLSHIGITTIEKILAGVREDDAPLTIEVDASTPSTFLDSIVLDSKLTLEYLIISGSTNLGDALTTNFDVGSSSKKKAHNDINTNIMTINSYSLDEEVAIITPNLSQGTSNNKTSSNQAYTRALQLIINYPTKYRFFSRAMSNSVKVERVEELPISYNENVIFELPPTNSTNSSMDGVEQCYNGHCWIWPVTTRISFPAIVRRSKWAGHLQCLNDQCPYVVVQGDHNEKSWKGKESIY